MQVMPRMPGLRNMTSIPSLDTVVRPVAKWLAGSALSAMTDVGLARIGVSDQAKAALFVAALVMLMIAFGSVALVRRVRQGNRPDP
ncbi:MAG: hypothetical protein K9K30_08245 [Burkholderiaceae bacterium]|nr:hypothetical protein [Sulfuritalea sp.]MCF8175214.1 hypothetical protein [Burkholderiaceae bacterium]